MHLRADCTGESAVKKLRDSINYESLCSSLIVNSSHSIWSTTHLQLILFCQRIISTCGMCIYIYIYSNLIVTTNEMSENQINIKATDQTIFSLVLSYSSTYSKN